MDDSGHVTRAFRGLCSSNTRTHGLRTGLHIHIPRHHGSTSEAVAAAGAFFRQFPMCSRGGHMLCLFGSRKRLD
eukprot:3085525-Amphidinium_carterae.1